MRYAIILGVALLAYASTAYTAPKLVFGYGDCVKVAYPEFYQKHCGKEGIVRVDNFKFVRGTIGLQVEYTGLFIGKDDVCSDRVRFTQEDAKITSCVQTVKPEDMPFGVAPNKNRNPVKNMPFGL